MELNQEFSGRKMDKDKTDRSQGACDSVWQSPSVAASSSQLSGWCNQKQSACYEKRLGVNVAPHGRLQFLPFAFQKNTFVLVALIIT